MRRTSVLLLLTALSGVLPAATAAAADEPSDCPQPYVVTFDEGASYGRQVAAHGTVSSCATGAAATGGTVTLRTPDGTTLGTAAAVSATGTFGWSAVTVRASGTTDRLVLTYDPGDGTAPQQQPVTVTTQTPPVRLALDAWVPVADSTAAGPATVRATVSTYDAGHTFPQWVTLLSPTGTVDVLDAGRVVATLPLRSAPSTFPSWQSQAVSAAPLASVRAGDTLTAVYHGDAGYPGATGSTTVTDQRQPTTLQITGLDVQGVDAEVEVSLTSTEGVVGDAPVDVAVDGKHATSFRTVSWSQTSGWGWGVTGGKHTVTVSFPGDGRHQPATATGTLVVPRVATHVTLSDVGPGSFGAVSPRSLERMQACVTADGGTASARVRIDRKVAGAAWWTPVGTLTTRWGTGCGLLSVRQDASSSYRAVVLSDATWLSATSRTVTVASLRRADVSVRARAGSATQDVITATVSPSGTLHLQELTSRGWVTRTVTTPHVAAGSTATVHFTVTRSAGATRTFRVVVPVDRAAGSVTSARVLVPPRR
ncbi:hypothetical protein [Luteimicrobium subarcticum]|uniref:Ig-like domain-containing protein n=1 Tax=Luteimicrobium subarcticum TaxID=620910 RepID=A0A2M8WTM6_9MICO|nr:hypothetical protein [Luteimicrobium subarcticum]PJI94248.1 hypothetical protein CLV34_1736 [Luteimicrobium subarcticum]